MLEEEYHRRLQDQMKINTELTADIIAKQILDSRKPPAKK